MRHGILVAFAIVGIAAGSVAVPLIVGAQTATSGDVLVEGGYRLPRSHQYQTYDQRQNSYVNVDVVSVPRRLAAGEWIYDRTAGAWVSHPSVGGKNPTYVAGATGQAQGDWQRIHGRVVSTSGSTLQFKADDGRTLTVDMSKVDPAIRGALRPNETATVIGAPGSQANRFTAQYIQQDSSDPSRGGTVVGQPGAATDQNWQRIHGTVGSVSGNTLTLRTDAGQTLTVDMAQVDPGIRSALTTGEAVTVIGFYRGADKKTVDARFIQQDSSRGAASPKTTK